MNVDILIDKTLLLPEPGSETLIPNGCVAVRDGRILYAGPASGCEEIHSRQTIDGRGCLTMPGLVNLHGHAPMTLFRGLADDLQLADWLNDHIFPAEARNVAPEMVYWCAKLAAAEMLLSGTTTTADGYFFEEEVARAFADTGLRAITAQGIIDFPAPGVPDPGKNIDHARQFLEKTMDFSPLIRPALFAHSPYTCSTATLRKAKELADRYDVPLYIHVAETARELSMIREPLADSSIRHLEQTGILDERTICVHCVHTDEHDLDILKKHDCPVILCPQSNLKLASGMADMPGMLDRGIRVGLGTDGCASNNNLDMFREMNLCAKLQKLHELDPVAVPAARILQTATSSGATIGGFPDHRGTLSRNAPADLILVDLMQPHLQPFYTPDLLVYSASGCDVRTVIIDGTLVVQDRIPLTLDLEEVMEKVRSLAEKV